VADEPAVFQALGYSYVHFEVLFPMSRIFVRLGVSFVQIVFLVFLSLCVGRLGAATWQSGDPGGSAGPAGRSFAIPVIGAQTTSHGTHDNKSKNDSFTLTQVEPLLLLLFGSILFAVATCIKLRLSRVNRDSSQYFEPLISQTAGRSETRS
jgi:hypothetical protein